MRRGAVLGQVGQATEPKASLRPHTLPNTQQGNHRSDQSSVKWAYANVPNHVCSIPLALPATPHLPPLHIGSISHQPPVSRFLSSYNFKKIMIQENTPTPLAHGAWSHSPRHGCVSALPLTVEKEMPFYTKMLPHASPSRPLPGCAFASLMLISLFACWSS